MGLSTGVTPWTYLLNQLSLIARYLGLTFWPRGLVLDYGLPAAARRGQRLLPGALVVGLGLPALSRWWRRPMPGSSARGSS